eukprot:1157654-Pelagomonas_calceolata.AAC.4
MSMCLAMLSALCATSSQHFAICLRLQLITNALFWYLERTIPGTLKWLYPTAPDRADKWLAEEIYRSACDSGSVAVFASVFYLPPPRALNYMINELYEKPTVLLTGGLDPLNDARGRTSQLSTLSPNAMVTVLEAGHCPHDEQPDQEGRRTRHSTMMTCQPGTPRLHQPTGAF